MNNFLKFFIFFSVFPAIKLFGISITLFIFLIFIISLKNLRLKILKSKVFVFFSLIVLVSSVSSFYIPEIIHPGILYIVKIVLQYFYWITVALFFKSNLSAINFNSLSKYFFLGTLCLMFSFNVYSFQFEMSFISINTEFTRNSFVFILLASFPFCIYYLINNHNLKKFLRPVILLFLLIIFFSEGRSGIVFFIIELLIISMIFNPRLKKLYIFCLGLIISAYLSSNFLNKQLQSFSYFVEEYNPRIGQFIRGAGESNIEEDKSLMIRLVMIDKTLEIFDRYPLIGIGPNMFTNYNASLFDRRNKYERLWYRSDEYLNSRSSHGAYYQSLAEFGLIGTTFLLFIILVPNLGLFKKIYLSNTNPNDLFIISHLGISLHFITVSALTGTIGWVIIGVAWGILNNKKV